MKDPKAIQTNMDRPSPAQAPDPSTSAPSAREDPPGWERWMYMMTDGLEGNEPDAVLSYEQKQQFVEEHRAFQERIKAKERQRRETGDLSSPK